MRRMVNVNEIIANPFQSRMEYGDVRELAEQIANNYDHTPETCGLLQVPRGRDCGDGMIQLLFGHRRHAAFCWLAERDTRFAKMPVDVMPATDEMMVDAVWAENRQRRDLSAVEEGELLRRAVEMFGNQREIAGRWKLDRSTVANKIRLLKLPEYVQLSNRQGQLSERQCMALLAVAELAEKSFNISYGKNTSPNTFYPEAISPQNFMQWAANHPADATSNMIRKYVQEVIERVGVELLGDVPNTVFEKSPSIFSETCRGCVHRINERCFRPVCGKAKHRAFAMRMLEVTSRETGIPRANSDCDFALDVPSANIVRKRLADGKYDGLVLGFAADVLLPSVYLYPTTNTPLRREQQWYTERGGCVVGVVVASGKKSGSGEYKPDFELTREWRKIDNLAIASMVARYTSCLVELCRQSPYIQILRLVEVYDKQTVLTAETLAEKLMPSVYWFGWEVREKLTVLLEQAGMDVSVLDAGIDEYDWQTTQAVMFCHWFWMQPKQPNISRQVVETLLEQLSVYPRMALTPLQNSTRVALVEVARVCGWGIG